MLPELTELVNIISSQYRNDLEIWELLVRAICSVSNSDDYHQLASQLKPRYNEHLDSIWDNPVNNPENNPANNLNILYYCARSSDNYRYMLIRIKYLDPTTSTADIFFDVFSYKYLYDPTTKQFFVYNGICWLSHELQSFGLSQTIQSCVAQDFDWFMDELALEHTNYYGSKQWWLLGGKPSFRSTINKLKPALTVNSLIWNQYGNFFAFDNKVFDLDTGDWVVQYPAQYLNSTAGYQWQDPSDQEIQATHEFLATILPNEAERNATCAAFAVELHGKHHVTKSNKKFILLHGHNQLFLELISAVFGAYVSASYYDKRFPNRQLYIIEDLYYKPNKLPDTTYCIRNCNKINYKDLWDYQYHEFHFQKFPHKFSTSHKFALFKILTDKLKKN